jgi:hypothetical protein
MKPGSHECNRTIPVENKPLGALITVLVLGILLCIAKSYWE